jgi:phosphoribosylaminoimidazolecarboxamide formyltransferase/IMP cyclohydrolase
MKVVIRRALVSVHDKTGLADLAQSLAAAGVEIVSTGSTAAAICAAGLPVTRVEEVTGFPECLGGRVKTLHPGVHAGLLADPGSPAHRRQLEQLGLAPFELLVCSLYPFGAAVAAGASAPDCLEQIDIGGPAMIRAAAKNHARVAVITDPAQYPAVSAALADGGFTARQRQRLAAQAFMRTAAYDAAIASWFAAAYAPDDTALETGWPDVIAAVCARQQVLRYGENPHQRAARYLLLGAGGLGAGEAGVAGAVQVQGKPMSFNNYLDAAAAVRVTRDFREPCVAIVKHTNPCGIAVGDDLAQAHRKAHACDPVSAYGGVIAANGVVTGEMARQVADVFTEVVIAPGFEPAALEVLAGKKNLRLLRLAVAPGDPGTGPTADATAGPRDSVAPAVAGSAPDAGVPVRDVAAGAGGGPPGLDLLTGAGRRLVEWRQLDGGLLAQTADLLDAAGDHPAAWERKAGPVLGGQALADLVFAWRACRGVKSNAIVLAAGGATVGVGMGQVNRVDAARLAVARAGGRARGAVAASDAFFPFPDGLQVLADAGVRAIVEPGGSVRDQAVIEAASAAGVSLYFTGTRHFSH